MAHFVTLWLLQHDGVEYPAGSVVELAEEIAAPLVGGVLARPEAMPAPTLEGLTVVQLRELAEAQGIDLGPARLKAEIIEALEAAGVRPE